MISSTIEVIAAAVLTFLVVVIVSGIFNWLVELARRCDQAAADIDVQLRQRNDLIPSLVAVVKGYAAHEHSTLEAVARARSAAMAAPAGGDKLQAERALESALGRLFAVAEQYPDLKASAAFRQLQDDISTVEKKIAAARRFQNNAVAEYNITRAQFPANVMALIFRFRQRDSGIIAPENRGTIDQTPSVAL